MKKLSSFELSLKTVEFSEVLPFNQMEHSKYLREMSGKGVRQKGTGLTSSKKESSTVVTQIFSISIRLKVQLNFKLL
jgi:hypothetical protein